MEQKLKHVRFQLTVNEFGVSACIAKPEMLVSFLLLISEAISNGFWVTDGREASS
jgi:hypothetical protein